MIPLAANDGGPAAAQTNSVRLPVQMPLNATYPTNSLMYDSQEMLAIVNLNKLPVEVVLAGSSAHPFTASHVWTERECGRSLDWVLTFRVDRVSTWREASSSPVPPQGCTRAVHPFIASQVGTERGRSVGRLLPLGNAYRASTWREAISTTTLPRGCARAHPHLSMAELLSGCGRGPVQERPGSEPDLTSVATNAMHFVTDAYNGSEDFVFPGAAMGSMSTSIVREDRDTIADDLTRLIETVITPILGVNLTGHVTEWDDQTQHLPVSLKSEAQGRPLDHGFIIVSDAFVIDIISVSV